MTGIDTLRWILKKGTVDLPRSCTQAYALLRHGWLPYRLARSAITERKALQRKWELAGLLGMVRCLRPNVILEIGTYQGGTLSCWPSLAGERATIISLDLPGGPYGGGYGEEDVARFQSWMKEGQSLSCLRRDSHSPDTLAEVRGLLAGRPIDLLFIDGDHSYEGVRADFMTYGPLVRKGGLIVLHDIVVNPTHPDCRVYQLWNELKDRYRSRELVDRDGFHTWGGIGVLVQG